MVVVVGGTVVVVVVVVVVVGGTVVVVVVVGGTVVVVVVVVVVVGGTVVVVGGIVVVVVVVSSAMFFTVRFWQTVTPATDVHVPVMPYSVHGWPVMFCAVTFAAAETIRGEQIVVPDPPKAVQMPSTPPTEQSSPTVFRVCVVAAASCNTGAVHDVALA